MSRASAKQGANAWTDSPPPVVHSRYGGPSARRFGMNVQPAQPFEPDDSAENPIRVRTIFVSDIHLGTRGCQAEKFLDFLRDYDADLIYLVGDIVDGWQLKSGWYWPQSHNDVVQKLLRKARKGARIVYVPGNHDEFMRDFYGIHF